MLVFWQCRQGRVRAGRGEDRQEMQKAIQAAGRMAQVTGTSLRIRMGF